MTAPPEGLRRSDAVFSAPSEARLPGPLDGLLVVGLEQAVAAPLATRHLADLGARVVKVENPRGGDFARDYDQAMNGLGAHFVWLNRGKESLALDVKKPAGAEVLARLIERADVVIQNLAPGAAARLGVAAGQVVQRHPRAVAVDISGYGEGGPLAAKRAYDLLVQSETGSCSVTGFPGQPAKPGIPLADVGAGMYAYSSVLAALLARTRTGQGAAISVSLFDAVAEWMGYPMYYTLGTGIEQQPNGMSSPSVAPYGAYRTADEQVLVVGTTNDREWQRLAVDVLGRPDLAANPSLAGNADRVRERAHVDAALGEWAAGQTLDKAQARLDEAGIGNARLNSVSDLIAHPQLAARDRWREIDSPVGPLRALLPPPVSPQWSVRMGPVPALGEHTDDVLAYLGYDPAQVGALREAGVV
ncbi:CaiB/BaiF CoA-transferase family protein [Frankia sp. Cppng1_Ct_nod]|uniref:CaiB/BaiF CoA transferase family protein n=1 Tax=Frankia sp. Cppng1_Ct_nod TaxID=2897162 RepID=UPI0010415661|nr:CaiB/BaiF CoA-transferase family protein [Frankia sp. Cppng1_Ct_nod]